MSSMRSSNNTVGSHLPEETLHSILTLALDVQEKFEGGSFTPLRVGQSPTSSVLLVSKRFCRIATPLLYRTVILRSSAQCLLLRDVLKAHHEEPSFGAFVQYLRVEGCYHGLCGVVECCPFLNKIILSMDVYYNDRIADVIRSFEKMDCRELKLTRSNPKLLNANRTKVFKALWLSLLGWTRLEIIDLDLEDFEEEIVSLKFVPTLRIIKTPFPAPIFVPMFEIISRNPSLEKIELRPTRAYWGTLFEREAKTKGHERLLLLISRTEREPLRGMDALLMAELEAFSQDSAPESPRKKKTPEKRPSSAASRLPPNIIRRIIQFAVLDMDLTKWFQHTPGITKMLRKKIAKVWPAYQSIIQEANARAPTIQLEEDFVALQFALRKDPSPAQQTQLLYLNGLPEKNHRRSEDFHFGTENGKSYAALNTVAGMFPKLKEYSGGEIVLGWAGLEGLASTSKELRWMKSLCLSRDAPKPEFGVGMRFPVRGAFEKLQEVEIRLCAAKLDGSENFFGPLPELWNLTLECSGNLIETFKNSELPKLTHLDIKFGQSSIPGLTAFLSVHGEKLEKMDWCYSHGTMHGLFLAPHGVPFLELCPNLERLDMVGAKKSEYPDVEFFQRARMHEHLKLLVIRTTNMKKREKLAAWLNGLAPSLRFYPALKEIRLNSELWPTEPRQIKLSPLVPVAETFKSHFGLGIKDASGREWVPRVKANPVVKQRKKKTQPDFAAFGHGFDF